MAVTVDQSKLILNAFMATFQNNLVSAEVASWKQHDTELNDRNRLTYSEQVGPRYNVVETTDGVADLSSGVQDTVFGSETFVVNKTFNTSMGWGDFVKIRDIGDARESEAIKNAALNLAEKIDGYVMRVAALASNNWVTNSPASDVGTLTDIMSGYTRLKEEGVDDANLRAVLSYADRQALSETLVEYPSTDGLATAAFRKGFEGEVSGIPTMFTQQLHTLTSGTRTNGAVNGANQNVDYKDVAISAAPGQYLTQTFAIDGLGANATIKAGEVFTIPGVFAYDNRLGASLGRLQQFTVVADATASAGGAATVRIFPAIIVPGSGSGGDINVNTAHATVTAAPANDAVVTFLGAASTAYKPRFILQKGAIRVNTAPLIMPASDMAMRKSLTRVPLAVRMWKWSDAPTGEHSVRFDVALTANVVDRRRIVRINGNT